MALTSTATKTLQRQIAYILGMYLPKVIVVPPCKNNIMYSVKSHTSLKNTFEPLSKKLKEEGTNMSRMIIYCRSIVDCADIYELGDSFLVPPDAPDQSKFRLVDMYTSY